MSELLPTYTRRKLIRTGLLVTASALLSGCYSMRTNLVPEPIGIPPRNTPTPEPTRLIERSKPSIKPTQAPVATIRPTDKPYFNSVPTITPTKQTAEPAGILIAPPPRFEDYMSVLNKINDPVYKAASCLLNGYKGDEAAMGHASIFIDEKQRLYMGTINHVVQKINGGLFKFFIAGIGEWELPVLNWQIYPKKTPKDDPPAFYWFDQSPNLHNRLIEKVAQGYITPLKASLDPLKDNTEAVSVMSDRGDWLELRLKPDTDGNFLWFKIVNGRACAGFSGQSVLLKENGTITNKCLGVIVGASRKTGDQCSSESDSIVTIRAFS